MLIIICRHYRCSCWCCSQVLPAMDSVIVEITRLAKEFADVPMLCRTHGQTASPSTMGKEMAVFAYRLQRQRQQVGVEG
jgi:adenylosuccinate lyase